MIGGEKMKQKRDLTKSIFVIVVFLGLMAGCAMLKTFRGRRRRTAICTWASALFGNSSGARRKARPSWTSPRRKSSSVLIGRRGHSATRCWTMRPMMRIF